MNDSITHNFPSIPKEFPQRTCVRGEISVRLSHLVQYENAIPSLSLPHTRTHTHLVARLVFLRKMETFMVHLNKGDFPATERQMWILSANKHGCPSFCSVQQLAN